MKTKTKNILIAIVVLLIVATLVFIHGNSMQTASNSIKISGRVYAKLNAFMPWLFNDKLISASVIRKLAHFLEFFALGLEFSLLFLLLNKFMGKKILLVLLIGIIDASLDEILQIFFSRGASVIDVLIDFSGYVLGVIVILLINIIINSIKKPTD